MSLFDDVQSNTYNLSTRVNEMDWDADIPVGFEMAVIKAYQKGRKDATDEIENDIIDISETQKGDN